MIQELKFSLKRIISLVAVLLIALSVIFLSPMQPANARVNAQSRISLFLPNEWKLMANKSNLEIAAEIDQRLDIMRDEIGRAALKIVHSFNTSIYESTEPVFFAVRDGGVYLFQLRIHWKRKIPIVYEGEHTTIIEWELLNNQHFHTVVQSDNSKFAANHLEELNYLFEGLLSTKT
jgi:hypothetical protein